MAFPLHRGNFRWIQKYQLNTKKQHNITSQQSPQQRVIYSFNYVSTLVIKVIILYKKFKG